MPHALSHERDMRCPVTKESASRSIPELVAVCVFSGARISLASGTWCNVAVLNLNLELEVSALLTYASADKKHIPLL